MKNTIYFFNFINILRNWKNKNRFRIFEKKNNLLINSKNIKELNLKINGKNNSVLIKENIKLRKLNIDRIC